jgi:hypothetical protein
VRRAYHPYTRWEDHRAGMYQPTAGDVRTPAALSEDLLSDPDRFEWAARAMVAAWPIAAEHNLTNTEQNRRAWVGQAACCYRHGAHQDATKLAWWRLSTATQEAANAVAERVVFDWEQARMSMPSLFDEPEAEGA